MPKSLASKKTGLGLFCLGETGCSCNCMIRSSLQYAHIFFSTCSWHGLEHKHTWPEAPPLWYEPKSKGRGSWQWWPHLPVKNHTNRHHTRQIPVSTLQCYGRHTGTFHRGREALGTPRWIDLTLLTSDKGSWRICAEQNLHSSPFNSPYSQCLYPSCVWYSVWMSEISNSQQNACQPHTQTQMTIYDMMQ